MLLCYTECQSPKREIIQSNIYRILPKVNQVIYTSDTICELNIMILAQMVLEIFCSQSSKCLQWKSRKMSKKGHNSATTSPTEKKNIRVCLCFMVIPHIEFQDPVSNRSWPYASVTDARTNRPTDRPKPICPLNFFEVGGIINVFQSEFEHKTSRNRIFVKISGDVISIKHS